jgi:hypothetical protein
MKIQNKTKIMWAIIIIFIIFVWRIFNQFLKIPITVGRRNIFTGQCSKNSNNIAPLWIDITTTIDDEKCSPLRYPKE